MTLVSAPRPQAAEQLTSIFSPPSSPSCGSCSSSSSFSSHSPASDPEQGADANLAIVRPSYGLTSFHLQPAPRSRKSARARVSPKNAVTEDGLGRRDRMNAGFLHLPSSIPPEVGAGHGEASAAPLLQRGQSKRGKFLEHLSWDARPTTAELDKGTSTQADPVCTTRNPELKREDIKDNQEGNQPEERERTHQASVQAAFHRRNPSVPISASSCEEFHSPVASTTSRFASGVARTSSSPRLVKHVAEPVQDTNIRLSTQAGSVASSRRNYKTGTTGPLICSPGRVSFASPTAARLRRLGSSSTLCCSSPRSASLSSASTTEFRGKKLGRRGLERAQRDSIVLLLPPMSPLSPRKAERVHTPLAGASHGLLTAHLLEEQGGSVHRSSSPTTSPTIALPRRGKTDLAPLSATLREIGAKRVSTALPTATSPLSALAFPEVKVSPGPINLPNWVSQFQANHHRRNAVLEENKAAVEEFSTYDEQWRKFQGAKPVEHDDQSLVPPLDRSEEQQTLSLGLPQLTWAGDMAPRSPNGDLLSGRLDLSPRQPNHVSDNVSSQKYAEPSPLNTTGTPRHLAVQSSIRGRPLRPLGTGQATTWSNRISGLVAALRTPTSVTVSRRAGPNGMGGPIRKGWRVNLPYNREEAALAASGAEKVAGGQADGMRRDGWGGILTRASWFRGAMTGPLVSPVPPVPAPAGAGQAGEGRRGSSEIAELQRPSTAATKPVRRARFKSLHLVEAISPVSLPGTREQVGTEEDWEDMPGSASSLASDTTSQSGNERGSRSADVKDQPLLERCVPRFTRPTDLSQFAKRSSNGSSLEQPKKRSGWQRLFDLGRPSHDSITVGASAATESPRSAGGEDGKYVYDDEIFVIGPRASFGRWQEKRISSSSIASSSSSRSDGDGKQRALLTIGKDSIESTPLAQAAGQRGNGSGGWKRKRSLLLLAAFLTILLVSFGLNVGLLVQRSHRHNAADAAIEPVSAAVPAAPTTVSVPSATVPPSTATNSAGATKTMPAPTITPTPQPEQSGGEPTVSSTSNAAEDDTEMVPEGASDRAAPSMADPIAPTTASTATSASEIEDRLTQQGNLSDVREAVHQSQVRKRGVEPDPVGSQRDPNSYRHHHLHHPRRHLVVSLHHPP